MRKRRIPVAFLFCLDRVRRQLPGVLPCAASNGFSGAVRDCKIGDFYSPLAICEKVHLPGVLCLSLTLAIGKKAHLPGVVCDRMTLANHEKARLPGVVCGRTTLANHEKARLPGVLHLVSPLAIGKKRTFARGGSKSDDPGKSRISKIARGIAPRPAPGILQKSSFARGGLRSDDPGNWQKKNTYARVEYLLPDPGIL